MQDGRSGGGETNYRFKPTDHATAGYQATEVPREDPTEKLWVDPDLVESFFSDLGLIDTALRDAIAREDHMLVRQIVNKELWHYPDVDSSDKFLDNLIDAITERSKTPVRL